MTTAPIFALPEWVMAASPKPEPPTKAVKGKMSYADAKSCLKDWVRQTCLKTCNDPIVIGSFLSQCLLFDFPPDPTFQRFTAEFIRAFKLKFANAPIEAKENYMVMAYFDPYIQYLDGPREQRDVGVVSDNMSFFLNEGSIAFRSMGNGDVELSRLLIDTPVRDKGIGTTLVELAKEVAKTTSCRLLLFPAPPLAESRGWNGSQVRASARRLRTWYTKLGFANALPEFKEAIRLGGDKKMMVGICDMMVFR